MGKPEFTACSHLRPDGPGCGRYAARPRDCRVFRCGWLSGMFEASDRPDRSGVMLAATPGSVFGERAVSVWEVRPGAAAEGRGAAIVNALYARGIAVTVVTREERRLLVPVELSIFGRSA